MLRAAVFDMDGLMFDTERLYQKLWKELVTAHGADFDPAFLSAVAGTSGKKMADTIRSFFPSIDPAAIMKECYAGIDRVTAERVPEKPGIHELIAFFRENGVKIAVASSSAEHAIEHHLRVTGLRDSVDAVVSGANVKNGKPAPDIFLLAAEKIGLPAGDCYVLEDGINGVHAGLAAGAQTIMIPDTMQPTEDILASETRIFPDLLACLEAIRAGTL